MSKPTKQRVFGTKFVQQVIYRTTVTVDDDATVVINDDGEIRVLYNDPSRGDMQMHLTLQQAVEHGLATASVLNLND